MKKIICIILLIIPNHIFSKPGYVMLNNHTLPVGKIRAYNTKEILCFVKLFDSINKMDQECRRKPYDYFMKNVRRVDSTTFNKYKNYFEHTGYFSFNRRDIWIKWIKNVDNFLTKNYAMQLHFSDRFAFDLMRLIEKSIYKKSCNEDDLMDYFVTYLFRQTEFKMHCFICQYFHVVLLPNMQSCPFHKYYKYAFYKYVEYCRSSDRSFAFVLLSGISIDVNRKFNWDNIAIKDKTTLASDNLIKKTIKSYRGLLEFIIKDTSPYKFQSGTYSVLLCTHPNVHFSPPHNLN